MKMSKIVTLKMIILFKKFQIYLIAVKLTL